MATNNGLRELLGKMSTEQLDGMLQAELQKTPPDKAAVMLIMEILKEREEGEPVEVGTEMLEAWEVYNASARIRRSIPARRHTGLLLRVASVLVVIGLLLFAVPQEAGAKSLWDRFLHVTDSIFEFFNPGDRNDHRVEHKFETDNPGLQQVYDAVVELGITDPVVPMWLPEGYELEELEIKSIPGKAKLYARFESLGNIIVYRVEFYNEYIAHEYYKDETRIAEYERGGTTHNVLRNNDMLVAIWTRDNVECSMSITCQEDILYEILESIYVMGDEN